MSSLDKFTGPSLVWLAEYGVGYYPVTAQPYDDAYWQRYRQLDDTPLGAALTNARVRFVRDLAGLSVGVDIGIGGGRYVREAECLGHDVNPTALRWLRDNGRNWTGQPVDVMTFWDSLEHIEDPSVLLAKTTWAFVSMPIYDDAEHVLRSKHFRKDEHCWYFTHEGFVRFMADHGFALVRFNHMESDMGREDITTYAFIRSVEIQLVGIA